MSRFSYNDSFRADVFMRLLDEASALLEKELRNELDVSVVSSRDAGWTSTVTDVALVLGLSREDWIAAYDDAKAYYENIGLKLE